MIYNCIECKYVTEKKSDFEKHTFTKKHIKNTKKIYICQKCNVNFQSRSTCYVHRKKCQNNNKNLENISNSSDMNDINSDIKIKLLEIQKELENEKLKSELEKERFEKEKIKNEKEKIKNENEKLLIKNEYEKKQNKLLKEILKNSNKTTEKALKITDKTISAIKYANEHFKNAPILTPIDNYNLLDYDITNEDDKQLLLETMLYHYRKNSVHKIFGDHIVGIYKKDKLEDQCMHTTDTSRMNYIVKISKNDNENNAKWYTDKNGIVICDVIIEKLINYSVDLLKWYQKKLTDEMNLNPGNINQEKQKKVENILGMLMDIDNGQLVKNTNKYIAPFFNLDK